MIVFLSATDEDSPWVIKHQVSDYSPYAEWTCNFPAKPMAIAFSFSACELALSALMAIRLQMVNVELDTSILNDGIGSLMIVYVCMTPAYLIPEYRLIRALMLVTAVVLGHAVVLIFFFMPSPAELSRLDETSTTHMSGDKKKTKKVEMYVGPISTAHHLSSTTRRQRKSATVSNVDYPSLAPRFEKENASQMAFTGVDNAVINPNHQPPPGTSGQGKLSVDVDGEESGSLQFTLPEDVQEDSEASLSLSEGSDVVDYKIPAQPETNQAKTTDGENPQPQTGSKHAGLSKKQQNSLKVEPRQNKASVAV
jgi:hypothetical protein